MIVEVAGAVIVVGVWATPLMYGVTVYDAGAPPLGGDHETCAALYIAAAVTLVTCVGAVSATKTGSTQ